MKTLEQLGISPAPWVQKVWATSDDYGHDVSDYNHRSICDMRLLQGETRIPNAHLIAASPDLYECLYEAVKEKCTECHQINDYESDIDVEWQMCKGCPVQKWRAALADASGESEVER